MEAAMEATVEAVEAAGSSSRGGGWAPRGRFSPKGVPSLQPKGALRMRRRRARALQGGGGRGV
jgi:hypothetical protein